MESNNNRKGKEKNLKKDKTKYDTYNQKRVRQYESLMNSKNKPDEKKINNLL